MWHLPEFLTDLPYLWPSVKLCVFSHDMGNTENSRAISWKHTLAARNRSWNQLLSCRLSALSSVYRLLWHSCTRQYHHFPLSLDSGQACPLPVGISLTTEHTYACTVNANWTATEGCLRKRLCFYPRAIQLTIFVKIQHYTTLLCETRETTTECFWFVVWLFI